jgi:hypothetical protein
MDHLDGKSTTEPLKKAATVGDQSGPKVKAIEDLLRLVARLIAKRHLRENPVTFVGTATRSDQPGPRPVVVSTGAARPYLVDPEIKVPPEGVRDAADFRGNNQEVADPDVGPNCPNSSSAPPAEPQVPPSSAEVQ